MLQKGKKTTTIDSILDFFIKFFFLFQNRVKPYSEVPGPKGLPIIGNSWRFAPFIGKFCEIFFRMFFFFCKVQ